MTHIVGTAACQKSLVIAVYTVGLDPADSAFTPPQSRTLTIRVSLLQLQNRIDAAIGALGRAIDWWRRLGADANLAAGLRWLEELRVAPKAS